jgi:hypothetical protein
MRDSQRIYRFTQLFATYWIKYQDLRFTQVANLFIQEAQEKGLVPKGDPFFIEEEDWIKALIELTK